MSESKHSPEFVRMISEEVYRITLSQSAGGLDKKWREAAADRMIADDDDGGVKFSNRAGAYDKITRVYLRVLQIEEPPK